MGLRLDLALKRDDTERTPQRKNRLTGLWSYDGRNDDLVRAMGIFFLLSVRVTSNAILTEKTFTHTVANDPTYSLFSLNLYVGNVLVDIKRHIQKSVKHQGCFVFPCQKV